MYISKLSAKCVFVKSRELQMEKVNVILSRHETELLLSFCTSLTARKWIIKLWHTKKLTKLQATKNSEQLSTVNRQLGKADFLTYTSSILNLKDKLELNS